MNVFGVLDICYTGVNGFAVTIIRPFHLVNSAVTKAPDFLPIPREFHGTFCWEVFLRYWSAAASSSVGKSSWGAGVLRRIRMPKPASKPPFGRRSYERKGETPKEATKEKAATGSTTSCRAVKMRPCLLCLGSRRKETPARYEAHSGSTCHPKVSILAVSHRLGIYDLIQHNIQDERQMSSQVGDTGEHAARFRRLAIFKYVCGWTATGSDDGKKR